LDVVYIWERVEELAQLDANWVKHSKATATIPALICLAVHGSPDQRKGAFETLAQLDAKWAQHPNAKRAAPALAKWYLSPDHLRGIYEPDELERVVRAIKMLARLGPGAREALPTLLIARATSPFPPDRNWAGANVRASLTPLLARLPDSVDPDWPSAPEALLAIPELIKLLEKKPTSAAELLARFGPAARCALPTLQVARTRVGKSPDDVKVIDEAIKRITAP
jgi:hypothetical protein